MEKQRANADRILYKNVAFNIFLYMFLWRAVNKNSKHFSVTRLNLILMKYFRADKWHFMTSYILHSINTVLNI